MIKDENFSGIELHVLYGEVEKFDSLDQPT
jgi:hypothetical protein